MESFSGERLIGQIICGSSAAAFARLSRVVDFYCAPTALTQVRVLMVTASGWESAGSVRRRPRPCDRRDLVRFGSRRFTLSPA